MLSHAQRDLARRNRAEPRRHDEPRCERDPEEHQRDRRQPTPTGLDGHRIGRRRVHPEREHRGPPSPTAARASPKPSQVTRPAADPRRRHHPRHDRHRPTPSAIEPGAARGAGDRPPASQSPCRPSESTRRAAPAPAHDGSWRARQSTSPVITRYTPDAEHPEQHRQEDDCRDRRTRSPIRMSRRSPVPIRRAHGHEGPSTAVRHMHRAATGANVSQPCNAMPASTHSTMRCSASRAPTTAQAAT